MSLCFVISDTYWAIVMTDTEDARNMRFTVNVLPSAGCAVTAGDGGVDVVEAPNGIVCSGGMAATDPLCTEQFKNTAIAALKVVSDPSHLFLGWIINGAEIALTYTEPLLLTTMPMLAQTGTGNGYLPTKTPANVALKCPACPTIAAAFRIPVHGSQPEQTLELTEVNENNAKFFRTFGGVRLHLTVNLPEEFRPAVLGYEWMSPEPQFVITNASLAALSAQAMSEATLKRVEDALLGKEFPSEDTLKTELQKTIVSFRMTPEVVQQLLAEEENEESCMTKIMTVIQDYMAAQPDFVQDEKRNESSLFQLVTTMVNDAKWNSGILKGKYDKPFRDQLAACAYDGDQLHAAYLQKIREKTDQRERLIADIVKHASRQGGFFESEFGDDALASGEALKRPGIYWQGEPRPDLNETVRVKVTYRGADNLPTTAIVERRIISRELALKMKGDDVTMFKLLVNFFPWQKNANTHEIFLLPVTDNVDSVTNTRMTDILAASYNEDFVNDHTYDLTRTVVAHYDDYRAALNAFGWNNGTPTQDHGTIKADYSEFSTWLQAAVAGITIDVPQAILPDATTQNASKYQLLQALSAQEIREQAHWQDWVVTISDAGAIGFLQSIPLNSERYNTHLDAKTDVSASCNLYKPDGNLLAGAQILNGYMSDAFSGKWTKPGDTPDDLLAKALAGYNGVERKTLAGSTWQTLFSTKFEDETRYHVVHIKQDLIAQGWKLTIKAFEQPYKKKETQP